MEWQTIITIITTLLSIVGVFLSYYFSIKAKIHAATESAVNDAEQDDKTAVEKMNYAVEQIHSLVPTMLKPFFTKKVIQSIVQKAFDKIEEYAQKQVDKDRKDD